MKSRQPPFHREGFKGAFLRGKIYRGVWAMAKSLRIYQVVALALAVTLAVPILAFGSDGRKHFNQGLKYEENRQWDKAAQEFALAYSEKPSNVEYSLHLQRALVSAAIMLVERGDSLAEKKDYNAAYNAYRQAFAFDPANELALIKNATNARSQGLPVDNLPTGGDLVVRSLKPKGLQRQSFILGSGRVAARMVKVEAPAIPGPSLLRPHDVVYAVPIS
jgi:tetratricopeptide (TPR) repeat protein